MANLRIPEEYKRGFVEIRKLDEAQVAELIAVLETVSLTEDNAGLFDHIQRDVFSISNEVLKDVTDTLASLYSLKDTIESHASELAKDICDAMDEETELEFSNQSERERVERLLTALLNIERLSVAAKSADLFLEYERTMHGEPRVLTDIRPVFSSDPEDEPTGAFVVHTLKLSYHKGDRVEEFFITLDSGQVDELIGVLGRASIKGESLKRVLQRADLLNVDIS